MYKIGKALTDVQTKKIERNLAAYKANFDYIRIEYDPLSKGFYIFTSSNPEADETHYAYCIEYLDGWLYGAVQANNKRMKSIL